jgi:hypothetical protein
MPSTSKSQQRLFGIVHAYQTGKIPTGKVSGKIKKIAKSISSADAKKYATTPHDNLKEILHTILHSPAYTEETLREIAITKIPAHVKGQLVDVFTAQMLVTVLNKLNEQNKNTLLQSSLNEMVAVSYKVLTY